MSADKNLKKSGSDVMNTDSYELLWKKPVIKIGMITMLIASALSFIPLIYLYIKYGIMINLATALKAWGLIVAVLVHFISLNRFPIIQFWTCGTYMSFLSGNISNTGCLLCNGPGSRWRKREQGKPRLSERWVLSDQ